MNVLPAGWTPERTERMKALWADGWSCSQIARELGGCSRNAVIGKLHRLGLSGRGAPSKPADRKARAPRLAKLPATPTTRKLQNRPFERPRAVLNPFDAGGVAAVKARAFRDPAPIPVLLLVGEHVTLADLKPQHCRWPVSSCLPGYGETILFCAAPKDPDHRSYCPFHREAAIDRSKSNSASKLARSLRRYTEPYVRRAS